MAYNKDLYMKGFRPGMLQLFEMHLKHLVWTISYKSSSLKGRKEVYFPKCQAIP